MIQRLLLANLKIFFRDRLTIFWALAFPAVFIFVFSLFNLDEPPDVKVAVVAHDSGPFAQSMLDRLDKVDLFDIELEANESKSLEKLKDGDYDVVLVFPEGAGSGQERSPRLVYGRNDSKMTELALGAIRGIFTEIELGAVSGSPAINLEEGSVPSRDAGYTDFLVPGILGMGIMNYAVIGIATTLVTYREKRILRRIQATPLPVPVFLITQVGAFLVLSVLQTVVILSLGLLVGASLASTFYWALPLALLGNFIFLNIGIIVAAASRTTRAASGMGNAITLPLMFLSGVFFRLDQLPSALARVVEALPLAPLLDAFRTVLVDGDPITYAWKDLAIIGGWMAASLILAVRTFKFE